MVLDDDMDKDAFKVAVDALLDTALEYTGSIDVRGGLTCRVPTTPAPGAPPMGTAPAYGFPPAPGMPPLFMFCAAIVGAIIAGYIICLVEERRGCVL